MRETLRYGVFQVGQIWCVVSPGQKDLGFPDRERALEAAHLIRTTHRMAGEPCEVFILDESGRLVRLPNPANGRGGRSAPGAPAGDRPQTSAHMRSRLL
jgi:hypothetical protein